MKLLAALLLLGLPLAAFSQVPQQQVEIQRALIQRDQQSAEFSRRGLENLHSNQLRDAGRQVNPELLPYERQSMERERELVKSGSEPDFQKRRVGKSGSDPDFTPLPLPGSGGPPHVVEPISTPSIGG
jgi:uncharacterized protein HemX